MKTVVMDYETSDLRSDIGTLLVACYGVLDDEDNIKELKTKTIQTIGRGSVADRERKLALWAREQWADADIVIGQNHIGFDRHFLDGVLFRYGEPMVPRRVLIDTYQTAKGKFAMSSSMKNMLDLWHLGSKDAPDKDDWRKANSGDKVALERITQRCETDVEATAALWRKLKPVFLDSKGR